MNAKTILRRTERAQAAIRERAAKATAKGANTLFRAWATLEGFTAREIAAALRAAQK